MGATLYDAPLAQMFGLATILGIVLTKEHRRIPLAPPVVCMILFTLWMILTYPFSLVPGAENKEQLEKVMKIMILNLVVLMPLYTRRHVDLLIAVLALSIGFFGLKGGIFAIKTGGEFQVRGGGGFIEPNNELALALVMAIPLLYYLMLQTTRRLWRWGLIAVIFFSAVGAIASQSRGALVAIVGMTVAFMVRNPSRFRLVVPILATGLFIGALMPDTWWDRMHTIQTYDEDSSALGRLNAWALAWRVAASNFFGGGFNLETPEIFALYAPEPDSIHVAHSIYFQVLGQHGFVGLFLYLSIWLATFRTCWWIHRNAASMADRQLARLAEASLFGFAVGGAFLNLAYFDGPYYIMIALVVLRFKVLGNRERD